MQNIEMLRQRRDGILKEIASLEQMRRGSVCEQFIECVRKDGSKSTRGPYYLYTFKQKGKTISRRVSRSQADLYRRQIEAFRRFQKLTRELTGIGEKISDLALTGESDEKKTPNFKSKKKKK